MAIDSLRANKLRSFLTLLGIIIGITSIISVISIIQGLDHYWKEKVSNFGPNTFVITQFPITTNMDKFFDMIRRNPEVRSDCGRLDQALLHRLRIGWRRDAQAGQRVRYGRQSLDQIDMAGTTPNIIDIEALTMSSSGARFRIGTKSIRGLWRLSAVISRRSSFLGVDPWEEYSN